MKPREALTCSDHNHNLCSRHAWHDDMMLRLMLNYFLLVKSLVIHRRLVWVVKKSTKPCHVGDLINKTLPRVWFSTRVCHVDNVTRHAGVTWLNHSQIVSVFMSHFAEMIEFDNILPSRWKVHVLLQYCDGKLIAEICYFQYILYE